MWTSESNAEKDYINFASEIGKTVSSGSWQNDYEDCCAKHELVPCSFIKTEELGESSHSLKILNAVIDIATWRSMLVACSNTGNTVKELCFSNIQITPKHIEDLSVLLKSSDAITSVKLDYITVAGEREEYSASLTSLITNSPFLQYLSLKGNNIEDSFVAENAVCLRNHTSLVCLSLAENLITDVGMNQLLEILPLAVGLNCISVKRNFVTGASLVPGVENLLCGVVVTPEIETELKAIGKIVADRNKSIKDGNKKRKKEGLPEVVELIAPASRVVKGESTLLVNRSIHTIDVSWNEGFGLNEVNAFADVSGRLMTAPPLDEGTGQIALTLSVCGLGDEAKEVVLGTSNFNGLMNIIS